MKLAGLTAMAVFYGCYFGKVLLQKRQGIRTDQLGRGKNGFPLAVERVLKAVSILVPAAELVSIMTNASCLPDSWRWIGVVLAFLGDGAFLAAVLTMKDSWRAGISPEEKTELVTSGIYGWSRNPAFLGFDLLYAGIAILYWNLPLVSLSAAAGFVFHLQIVNVEEPFLQETFGEDYLRYAKRTRRYFGKRFVKES